MVPDKTRAVQALVEGTPEFRHVVYALNRVNGWSGIGAVPFGEDRIAVAYRALPKGLFWEGRLGAVAGWIIADLKHKGIVPDLVAAHKFTVEGLIGQAVSKAFGVPLVCGIQGDTDTKILRNKPALRARYRDIAEQAAVVFPYAPWAFPVFHAMTGLDKAKCRFLPVVPACDDLSPAPYVAQNKFVTVFNSDSWDRKNLVGVMAGMKLLTERFPDITLDVYGRGKPDSMLAMIKAVRASGVQSRVAIRGPVQNALLSSVLKGYAGFVLPSKRETYGLVYAEALFAGVPVLFSKGRGIDGYFDETKIGYACDPFASKDIAAGLAHVLVHQAELKDSIAHAQSAGLFDVMRKGPILEQYRAGLKQALGS